MHKRYTGDGAISFAFHQEKYIGYTYLSFGMAILTLIGFLLNSVDMFISVIAF